MDRKALAKAYKTTARPMGIYGIRNTVSGRILVGWSVDLPSAINRDRAALGFGGHPNAALQLDWNDHGPTAFAFEVLDTLVAPERADYAPAQDLKVLESLWLERLAPYGDRGYLKPPRVAT